MDIVIRALVIFFFVWFVLRALGKRELGEMTAFELVLLFVIGDLVQQSITQDDTSVTAAILAISTIALLIVAESYGVFRWKRLRPVLEGEPVVLVVDGHIVESTLRRERMSTAELKGAARQQGIDDLAKVQFAILETSGKLSFLTEDSGDSQQGAPEHLAG
jgi:uncharacterized membrane protein YcaP (DUF421 family)